MIVRTAIFVGKVDEVHQSDFDRVVREEALPCLMALPGVVSVDIMKTLEQETGLPGIYQTYHLHFRSVAAMEAMFESEERKAVHQVMSRILPWFDGQIVHLVSDGG